MLITLSILESPEWHVGHWRSGRFNDVGSPLHTVLIRGEPKGSDSTFDSPLLRLLKKKRSTTNLALFKSKVRQDVNMCLTRHYELYWIHKCPFRGDLASRDPNGLLFPFLWLSLYVLYWNFMTKTLTCICNTNTLIASTHNLFHRNLTTTNFTLLLFLICSKCDKSLRAKWRSNSLNL